MILLTRIKNILLLFVFAFACTCITGAQSPSLIAATSDSQPEQLAEPALGAWHWFFAAGDLVTIATVKTLQWFNTETFIKLFPEKPISPELLATIHEIVRKQGMNPDELIIRGASLPEPCPAATVGKNGLIIDSDQAIKMDEKELTFVLAHELAHLKNNDNFKQAALLFALPFISHFGLKAWDTGVHASLSHMENHVGTDTVSGTILSKIDKMNHWMSTFCMTKCVLAWQLFYAYSRYCEKQADLDAISNLQTSEGAEQFFERMQEQYKLQREASPLGHLFIDEQGNNILPLSHPTPSDRIAHCRERALMI